MKGIHYDVQCRYCLCQCACGKLRCLDPTGNVFNLLYLSDALAVSQNEELNPSGLFAMDHTSRDVHLNWKEKYSSNLSVTIPCDC